MTALKPVHAEQVRRPERSHLLDPGDKPRDPTNPVLSWEKPAQWDRRNRLRLSKSGPRADIGGPEHQPLYIFFIFVRFLAVSFKSICHFFGRSGPRELVPWYSSPRPWTTLGQAATWSLLSDFARRQNKLKLEKVALDGSVECCAPPPRWCDLDFDLLTQTRNQVICVPICTSDKSLAKIRQQILEISRKHKTTMWITDGRTDGRTDGQRHGRPENI